MRDDYIIVQEYTDKLTADKLYVAGPCPRCNRKSVLLRGEAYGFCLYVDCGWREANDVFVEKLIS